MAQYGFKTTGKTIVLDFPAQVKDRIFAITGPSAGGIGAETAISLAHGAPSQILLLGRTLSKIQPTIDAIHSIDSTITTRFIPVDLSSLTSVRATAKDILEDESIPRIDVLFNNAAIMACPYSLTVDGFESQFATNHLSHFLLTSLLFPKILAAGPAARIVNVSSQGHGFSPIHFDNPNYAPAGDGYTPWGAYGQAKTANILFSLQLSKQLRANGSGLRAYALHPGSIATNLQVHVKADPGMIDKGLQIWEEKTGWEGKLPKKSLQEGCATSLRAALDLDLERPGDEVETAEVVKRVYLHDCQIVTSRDKVMPHALDEADAERLWGLSEEMVGEKFVV
ncbi:hypothetical protein BP6252_05281 [Coleophoma cylindrospora]|uniref:Uncharacterized protein n=1 Tax=Coleophoma cylindrospora TaxID=1849047 RepID=A0A3D8RTE2_9HELO|nr:hypothetical protein BP6252_05281 [Coleophoma cylindrospora]